MISRIYVTPRKLEKHGGYSVVASYLLVHKLPHKALLKVATALTNPILERFSINKLPLDKNFSYAIEIGYLPGVTDNVAHTAKEVATDLLHLKNTSALEVYTSEIFFISGKATPEEIKKTALSLYNPLIETAYIRKVGAKQVINLPLRVPKVVLKKRTHVVKVSLQVPDEELAKIGKLGIANEDGTRRGPLALSLPYMKAIQEHFARLKREPADIELESLAQTWSEHCKHIIFGSPIDDITDGLYKTYIKGATNLIRKKKGKQDFCVSVFKDNAGGIIFDKNFLITHKVETHNAPSALDPFGGAITGIVGVNRDTIGFGLGAKPIANTYGFCFGEPEDKRPLFRDLQKQQQMLLPKRIMEGVIKGINAGGNCSGIPTVSGFVKFDERYRGKPLVFAGTVGLIPRKVRNKPADEKKAQKGDLIVVVGGRVGADGIHGATFSSVAMDANSPAAAVQIGDPITQKKLSDAIVKEARDMGLYHSITDNGAGGLSCSVAEMAKESGGAKVQLEKVSLKYPGLRPWEIWISESQERMTLAVPKQKWKKLRELLESRGVEATAVGVFSDSGKCVVEYKGKKIMDMDMEFLHNGLPKQHLTASPYSFSYPEPKMPEGISRTKIFEKLLQDINLSGFSFISEQYDHEVQASSVLKPLSGPGRINTDAQIFRPVLNSKKGVVVSSGIFPSYSDINTYHMAACAIDTAVRNAICAGGTLLHLAILDNFCWSSSDEETRLGQLVDAVKACYDCATGYGTPLISGKDSMFNDFKGYDERANPIKISIPPTLLISAISVMPDFYKTVSPEFKKVGDYVYLLGKTNNECGGGEYYKLLARRSGGVGRQDAIGNNVPQIDLEKNLKTYLALEKAIQKELLASAISVTSGGFGIALAKACVGGMLGCKISLKNLPGEAASVDAKLFSESQGRILVSVDPKNAKVFEKLVQNVLYAKLGKVSGDGRVVISETKKIVETSVKKLHTLYHSFSNKMS